MSVAIYDDLTDEQRLSVEKFYQEVNELLDMVSPGATIELDDDGSLPCNLIKTPSRSFCACSPKTPAMLRTLFKLMFPYLRGESVLVDAINFSEKHADTFNTFNRINSSNPDLLKTIEMYRKRIRMASNETEIYKIYQEIAYSLHNEIVAACVDAKFVVYVDSGNSSTVLVLPSAKLMCEYPIEILGFLSVIKPVGEKELIECVKLSTKFGEMFYDLHTFAYDTASEKVQIDISKYN